ncbi:hypothetical protein [Nannocystis punicea]|uniref:Uncharacterized protein n=1 Tax=Nannocystis punicea TaxID=2995304 RepID=A0ABY7H8E8_9BACT|nr:hypothetical protein [Nannocystis poenicansa]WAS95521.1 hypothetical protein O0S08_05110 [Nannocystis poenicansa]
MHLRAGGYGFAGGGPRTAIVGRGGTALVDARTGVQSSFLADVGALGWLDPRTLLARVWLPAANEVAVPGLARGGSGEVLPRMMLVSVDVVDGAVKPSATVPYATAVEYLAGAREVLVVHGSEEFTVVSTTGQRLWGVPAAAVTPLSDERSFLGAVRVSFVNDPSRARIAVVGNLGSEVRSSDSGEVLSAHSKQRILGFSTEPAGIWAQAGEVRLLGEQATAGEVRLDLGFAAKGAAQHGDYVVFFGAEHAELWSIAPALRLHAWSHPGASISSAAWIEDGCRVLLAADEGSWLYDPRAGGLVKALPRADLAPGGAFQAFVAGGQLAVSDGLSLTLWSPGAPGPARRRDLSEELAEGAASGQLLVDPAGDGLLWLVEGGSGTAMHGLDASLAAARELGTLPWSGPGREVRVSASMALAASAEALRVWTREGLQRRLDVHFSGPRLAAVSLGPRSGDVYVHRAGSSAIEQLGPGGRARRRVRLPESARGCIEALEISADEQWLAAVDCSGEVSAGTVSRARLERLELSPRHRLRPYHPFHQGSRLAWSRLEARLLVVDDGRDPVLIDMRRPDQATVLRDPQRPAAVLASGPVQASFTLDGAQVLVRRSSGLFELWEGGGTEPLARLALFADGSWVVWHRDGRYQVSDLPGAAAASFAAGSGVRDPSLAATLFAPAPAGPPNPGAGGR